MPYTAERMDQIFQTLTLPGFESAMRDCRLADGNGKARAWTQGNSVI
jgi:hypothetical protein